MKRRVNEVAAEKYHLAKRLEHSKRIQETRSRYSIAAWLFFGAVFLSFACFVGGEGGIFVVAAVGVMTFVAFKVYMHVDTRHDRLELEYHRREQAKARGRKQPD